MLISKSLHRVLLILQRFAQCSWHYKQDRIFSIDVNSERPLKMKPLEKNLKQTKWKKYFLLNKIIEKGKSWYKLNNKSN